MKTKKVHGSHGHITIDYLPDCPKTVVPVIQSEFIEDGIRYYLVTGGGTYIADKYDQMFKPVASKVIMPKGFKGITACKRDAALI